jgi:hypothetical protein
MFAAQGLGKCSVGLEVAQKKGIPANIKSCKIKS